MAAYTEYYSPWAANIQEILFKTQRNLRRTQNLSKNRTKSMFTNSSEFSSTNFSLERTGNYDSDIEAYIKYIQDSLEEKFGDLSTQIIQIKSKINKLSQFLVKINECKRETLINIDKQERKLINSIQVLKNYSFLNPDDLEAQKKKIIFETEQKIKEFKGLLDTNVKDKVNVQELYSQITYKYPKFISKAEVNNFVQDFKENLESKQRLTFNKIEDFYEKIKIELNQRHQLQSSQLEKKNPRVLGAHDPAEDLSLDSIMYSLKSQKKKINEYKDQLQKFRISLSQKRTSEYLINDTCLKADFLALNELVDSEVSKNKQKYKTLETLESKLSILERKNIESKKIPKIPDNYVKICINNMGESDDESIGFTSPSTSPMNQILVYGNSTKHTNKKFMFNGDTIHEDPMDEEDRLSPEV
jgi:hypothetical protein